MCRSLTHGGRRCPTEADKEIRRAKDRARYAAKRKAAGGQVRGYTRKGASGIASVADAAVDLEKEANLPEEGLLGSVTPQAVDYEYLASEAADLRREFEAILENNGVPTGETGEAFREWEQRKQVLGEALEDAARKECSMDIQERLDSISRTNTAIQELTEGWTPVAGKEVEQERLQALAQILIDNGVCSEVDLEGKDLRAEARDFLTGGHPYIREALSAIATARLAVLSRVRPMGGEVEVLENSTKKLQPLREAAAYFPSEWIDMSNREGNLRIKNTKGRAHYSGRAAQRKRQQRSAFTQLAENEQPPRTPYRDYVLEEPSLNDRPGHRTWKVQYFDVRWPRTDTETPPRGWKEFYMDEAGQTERYFRRPQMRLAFEEVTAELTIDATGLPCAVHEFSHRVEHVNPKVSVAERLFLDRRAAGEKKQALYAWTPRETGYKDDFSAPYQGRVYSPISYSYADGSRQSVEHFEIMSTGMEAMFGGSGRVYGGMMGLVVNTKEDRDFIGNVMGILAAV